jgi:hypothetical protein
MGTETSGSTVGRGRVRAFRIVAGLFGALSILANAAFGLGALFDQTMKVHTFHLMVPLFIYTLLVGVPLVALAIHPTDVVPLRLAWAVLLGAVIASFMGEDFLSGTYYIGPIVLVVLTILAPTRGELLRFGSPNIAMLSLAVIAAIPAIVYAWHNARIMLEVDPAMDTSGHWSGHHWSGIAGVVLGLVLGAGVLSFRQAGDRLWVWMVGLAAMLVGLTAIVYSDEVRYPSSLGTWWGVLTLFVGLVYIGVGEVSGRAPAGQPPGVSQG